MNGIDNIDVIGNIINNKSTKNKVKTINLKKVFKNYKSKKSKIKIYDDTHTIDPNDFVKKELKKKLKKYI